MKIKHINTDKWVVVPDKHMVLVEAKTWEKFDKLEFDYEPDLSELYFQYYEIHDKK